ncbi:protein-glutamate O-methyltransferase CheR [Falsiroseomonas sp.]|uniref:CheR family methyltransferase n=1 Tax=Falsiroseomonas sp. TaxID=2870721 RepID=UPI002728E547|nr:protein-glutamate O-methyltransferase [Falsiroseomonas sp.]MDO9499508.1 protein-glutamate O-methyltransferase [Falsiroseomonas sp.]MDP3415175.1 protein-glutamate O-methyltransferase [Falsiroseomonas sp.]
MNNEEFAEIAGVVRRRSGIVLTSDKAYLLETRLGPILSRFKLPSLSALGQKLRQRPDEVLERAVVEALTTHESSFFRDGKPFEHLAKILPRLISSRSPGAPLRIWSAACSTGQEPFSIAMLVADALGGRTDCKVEILATDISAEILQRARLGVFTQFEVQRGLPIRSLVKHFRQDGAKWRIAPELAAMVRFEERNLLNDLSALGRFDTIFCRNVLIYFDAPTKTRVLEALARRLSPEGVLYLGGAETVLGLTDRLVPIPGERGAYGVSAQRAAA